MVKGIDILEKKDDFNDIFTKTGTMAYERQQNLSEVIGENNCEINFEDGLLVFPDNEFPMQIIGSLSQKEEKWSWAWDNDDVGFPQILLEDVNKIKKIGEEYNIPEFSNSILTNVNIDVAHILLMTVAPLVDADAYYAVDAGDLILFVTIHSDEIPTNEDLDKFSHNFNDFQIDYPVNARKALKGYTILKGYEFVDREDFSMAKTGQQRVIVGFSDRGKVTNIQTMK